jgi:2-amino-4-hydroxy-6-hydroxymethyldihydropteridine diphosphokinase/dihydropteroate synthase
VKVFLSLGTNLGNRLLNLERAVALLEQRSILSSLQCSIVLETKALLPEGADITWNKPYLNMVVCGERAQTSPEDLLSELKAIEVEMGRDLNAKKWAPRVIDLDILLIDGLIHDSLAEGFLKGGEHSLSVPHAQLINRPFLIHLIALLDPFVRHSKTGQTFMEIASSIPEIWNCFTSSLVLRPCLVGIVNITPDSFSDGGLYLSPDKALSKAQELSKQGAHVVEFGAQSTRPGARLISNDEEYAHLQPVLTRLADTLECKVGLDSFSNEVICKVLKLTRQVEWINDVRGDLSTDTLRRIADSGCTIVCMHSMGIPPASKQNINFSLNPIDVLNEWVERTVQGLLSCGFRKESIVVDPGIGFGKSVHQNIFILKHVARLKSFGCKILIGASRKSYIAGFSRASVPDRDLETLGISKHLVPHIDYLRVHNIAVHQRYLVSSKALA